MRRVCAVRCGYIFQPFFLNDLLKLRMTGARGISIMFSSGDNGVGDGDPNPATQKCFTNVGRNVTKFIPDFPASYVISFFRVHDLTPINSCPLWITNYLWAKFCHLTSHPSVTTVGGTTNVPEVAVTRFFSGGGFSNYVSCREANRNCMTNQKSIIFSSLDLPTRQLMSMPIWMLFPKELSQVFLIRELFRYGTLGAE